MKELSAEDLENLTLEKANEIIQEYGRFMEVEPVPFAIFEDDLPWSKGSILAALLTALKSEKNKEQKDILSVGIICLNHVIPSPKKYKESLKMHNITRTMLKYKRSGLSKEKIIEKMDKIYGRGNA